MEHTALKTRLENKIQDLQSTQQEIIQTSLSPSHSDYLAFAAYKRLVANQYVWAGSDYFKPEIATTNSSISVDKEYVLRQFIESCCILDDNSTTATSELQAAYNLFCSKNSYSPVQGDRFSRELFAVLPDNILRVKIGNQRRGFKGIRLKSVLL